MTHSYTTSGDLTPWWWCPPNNRSPLILVVRLCSESRFSRGITEFSCENRKVIVAYHSALTTKVRTAET